MANVPRVRNNWSFSNRETNCEAGLNGGGQGFACLEGSLPAMGTLRLLLGNKI